MLRTMLASSVLPPFFTPKKNDDGSDVSASGMSNESSPKSPKSNRAYNRTPLWVAPLRAPAMRADCCLIIREIDGQPCRYVLSIQAVPHLQDPIP
jgi:hypothetical protein